MTKPNPEVDPKFTNHPEKGAETDQFNRLEILKDSSSVPKTTDGKATAPIGTASMDSKGNITLQLKPDGLGQAPPLEYRTSDPEYAKLLSSLKGLQPGESTALFQMKESIENHHSKPVEKHLSSDKAVRSIEQSGCSNEHAGKVEHEWNNLAPKYKHLLENHGYHVVAAKRVVDVLDTKDPPSGYPPNWNWEEADGVCDRAHKHVVVAEELKSGPWVKADDVHGVFLHETGHAVDYSLGDFSQGKEFTQAFSNDWIKNIKGHPELEKKLNYFLQGGIHGRQETFAEIFAQLNGGHSRDQYDQLMKQYFPQTYALVQKKVDRAQVNRAAVQLVAENNNKRFYDHG